MRRRKYVRRSILERFSALYDPTSGCWQWLGILDDKGYGRLNVGYGDNKAIRLAHRIAYELYVGPIPYGLSVCHRCDNPRCVRPAHLFAASQGDNIRDMWTKGRAKIPSSNGASNSNARMTYEQVRSMRHLYYAERRTQQEIADYFGLAQAYVSRVVRRSAWSV